MQHLFQQELMLHPLPGSNHSILNQRSCWIHGAKQRVIMQQQARQITSFIELSMEASILLRRTGVTRYAGSTHVRFTFKSIEPSSDAVEDLVEIHEDGVHMLDLHWDGSFLV
jgi:hypothetical protein